MNLPKLKKEVVKYHTRKENPVKPLKPGKQTKRKEKQNVIVNFNYNIIYNIYNIVFTQKKITIIHIRENENIENIK